MALVSSAKVLFLLVIITGLVWQGSGLTEGEQTFLAELRDSMNPVLNPEWVNTPVAGLCALAEVGCQGSGNLSRITSLTLQSTVSAQVALPPSIANLHLLQSLIIKGWSIIGSTIPSEICQLGNMTTLVLDFAHLGGTVPKCMNETNLPKLKNVELYGNGLHEPFPAHLLSLPLAILSISSNFFYGTIPEALATRTNLTQLFLADNWFSGTIPEALGDLPNLTTLTARGYTGTCELFENWFDMNGSTICGDLTWPYYTVCGIIPVNNRNTRLETGADFSVGDPSLLLRAYGSKVAFFARSPYNGSTFEGEHLAIRFAGVTHRLSDGSGALFAPVQQIPVPPFLSIRTDNATRTTTLSTRLPNGALFEPSFRFTNSSAKLSVAISNWTAPNTGTYPTTVGVHLQVLISARHSNSSHWFSCLIVQGYNYCESPFISATLSPAQIGVGLALSFETPDTQSFFEFSGSYFLDGNITSKTVRASLLNPVIMPFTSINSFSRFGLEGRAEDTEDQAISTMGSVYMEAFATSMVWDPDFSILWKLSPPVAPKAAPTGEPSVVSPISAVDGVAIGVGVGVAVLAVAVVLGVLFGHPALRQRVFPNRQRSKHELQFPDDDKADSSPSATERVGTRPAAAKTWQLGAKPPK